MLKRGIILFILFSGILGCLCDNETPFWEITDFTVIPVDGNGSSIENDTLTSDSLIVVVDFDILFVAANNHLKNLFTNSAMAADCLEDGENGIKTSVSNITLTCDQPYNNFAAGESLNSIVRFDNQEGFQAFVNQVNDFPGVDFFNFFVVEKPTNIDSLNFTVKIDFSPGFNITNTSESFFWK